MQSRRQGRRLPLAAWLAAVAAVAVYLNTLPAQFTFDDSFAVLYNGDVTDRNKPLRALLTNDFWGQELKSPMSHKSYRPLTVLSLRLQHRLGDALLGERSTAASGTEAVGEVRRSSAVSPVVFHVSNVATHAGVTLLVYRLAARLAEARRGRADAETGSSSGSGGGSAGSGSGSNMAAPATLEAFIAALLFALHPVHTEAVAGIVGHAELLCAALSIPALLCYMAAADGRCTSMAAHWGHVAGAVALGWAAAAAKEIGITIMGAMVCYDVLVAPLEMPLLRLLPANHSQRRGKERQAGVASQPPPQQQQQQQQPKSPRKPSPKLSPVSSFGRERGQSRGASPAAVAAAATQLLQQAAASGGGRSRLDSAVRRQAGELKLLRIAVAAVAVIVYVKTRSWLAGDQLVRIYRKVENPIPFAASSLTRKLTTGYLHARYAWLLLAPLQLSADWSYACIEYVSSLSDPRNLATAALYLCLLYIGVAARPWHVLQEWNGRQAGVPQSQAEHVRRWHLAVAAGLLVGPFFPAANVLFYVGTFIGERLLYLPSVGYCVLLAHLFAAALQPLLPQLAAADSSGKASEGRRQPSCLRKAGAAAAAAALAALLCFYAGRTVLRNRDWHDEERLFRAAQQVCWRSGKVQLNSGIVERRYHNWDKAEMHFRMARAADPGGFCEPDFHLGVTLLNRNLTRALEYLELGVACKYTAADAVKGLNQVFQQLLESTPQHAPEVMERWGTVLARPELQRYAEAATYLESAALKARSPLQAAMILNRAQALLTATHPVPVGRTPDFPVRSAASPAAVSRLAHCLAARRPVVLAAVGAAEGAGEAGLASGSVKAAAYRYITQHGDECRAPLEVPAGTGDTGEDAGAGSTTFHTGLMHALQQADVNDPWVQTEWGRMLVAAGRHQEALAHLEAAGHIFAAQLQPPGQAPGGSGPPRSEVLDSSGKQPIGQREAGEAAVAAYIHGLHAVQALQPLPGLAVDPAAQRRVACHLQYQACGVRQLQGDAVALQQCLSEAAAMHCPAPERPGRGSGEQPGEHAAAAERDELR